MLQRESKAIIRKVIPVAIVLLCMAVGALFYGRMKREEAAERTAPAGLSAEAAVRAGAWWSKNLDKMKLAGLAAEASVEAGKERNRILEKLACGMAGIPDKERQAYMKFLLGDFSQYSEEDIRPPELKEQEGLFIPSCRKEDLEFYYGVGGEDWSYILTDLDGDGSRELFVRLGDKTMTGIFHYGEGVITCWDLDTMDAVCYYQPLEDGLVLETSGYSGRPNGDWIFYTTRRYRGEAYYERLDRYTVLELGDWQLSDFREQYSRLLPEVNEPGIYYLWQDLRGSSAGKPKLLSAEEWQAVERDVLGRTVPKEEWLSIR